MSNKKMWVMMVGALIFSLISATSLAVPLLVGELSLGNETLGWELARITLVTPGQMIMIDEGTVSQNYTIEVKAKAKANNLVPEGQVRLTLTTFSPARDGSGGQEGLWYVQDDNWAMTEKDTASEVIKIQYNP